MSVAGNPGSSHAIHLKTAMDPASPDPARRPISQIDIALSEGVTRKFSLCMRDRRVLIGAVNVNFQKYENGMYTTMSTAKVNLANGHYQVSGWGVGVGQWRVRAVFPDQGAYTSSESDYHELDPACPDRGIPDARPGAQWPAGVGECVGERAAHERRRCERHDQRELPEADQWGLHDHEHGTADAGEWSLQRRERAEPRLCAASWRYAAAFDHVTRAPMLASPEAAEPCLPT